jgi:hypothetical protein
MFMGGATNAIVNSLMLNFFIKLLIALIVTPLAIYFNSYPKPDRRNLAASTLIISIGGTLVFQVFLWIPLGIIGAIIGFVAFWIATSAVLDRIFNITYDQSYSLTGQIVGISILLWVILGAVIFVLSQKII